MSDVTINTTTSRISIVQQSNNVLVSAVGVQGPPGPSGSAAAYVHTQSSASTTWTINHNLGFVPSVSLYTVGGVEFEAEVVNVSNNQCVVYLVTALAGTARLI